MNIMKLITIFTALIFLTTGCKKEKAEQSSGSNLTEWQQKIMGTWDCWGQSYPGEPTDGPMGPAGIYLIDFNTVKLDDNSKLFDYTIENSVIKLSKNGVLKHVCNVTIDSDGWMKWDKGNSYTLSFEPL